MECSRELSSCSVQALKKQLSTGMSMWWGVFSCRGNAVRKESVEYRSLASLVVTAYRTTDYVKDDVFPVLLE
jgi:hypothetical protein